METPTQFVERKKKSAGTWIAIFAGLAGMLSMVAALGSERENVRSRLVFLEKIVQENKAEIKAIQSLRERIVTLETRMRERNRP